MTLPSNPQRRIQAAALMHPNKVEGVPVLFITEWAELENEHGDVRDGDQWGPWEWNAEEQTLDYRAPSYALDLYAVDVKEIRNAEDPAEAAWGWVRFVASQIWQPVAIGNLILALESTAPEAFV